MLDAELNAPRLLRVLVATDGSAAADAATALAAALPLPTGATFRAVSVTRPWNAPLPHLAQTQLGELASLENAERDAARAALQSAADLIEGTDRDVDTRLLEGDPAHAILAAAEEFSADLIAVGSRGLTGLEGFLLGGVARNVAKHAHCSVLVAHSPETGRDTHPDAPKVPQSVVVGVDGSHHGGKALELVAGLGWPSTTRIMLAHVVASANPYHLLPPGDPDAFHREIEALRRGRWAAGRALLEPARQRLERAELSAETDIREGDAANELMTLGRERDADLIVCGARGSSLIQRLLVGSVADRLLRGARIPVLLAR
jgi:nucleotide-binding universal stress UspA family protein